MKKSRLIYLWILVSCSLHAQDNASYVSNKKINWGIKAGVSTDLPIVKIGNKGLWSETTNEVEFQIDGLIRINFKHLFFQPEVGYSNTSEIFHISEYGGTATPQKTTIRSTAQCSNFSALAGYYTVKKNEYALSIFSGCKLKFAHHINTTCPGQEDVSNNNILYNIYISTGLGVNISKLFFDFRYDIALSNKDLAMPQLLLPTYGDTSITKRANILSFSVGMMF